MGVRDLPNRRPQGLLTVVCLSLGLVAASALPLTAQAQAPAVEVDVPTAPVTIDGAVLFRVRGASSLPAETRARTIRDRITAVAADRRLDPSAVHVADSGGVARITASDQPLMSIVDADAEVEGVSRTDLATIHAVRIQRAIADYRAARSPGALAQSAWRTAGASLGLLVALLAMRWFWRRLDGLLRRRVQARIHTIGIQSFEVMRAERIHAALDSVVFVFRMTALLAVVLVYLGYALGQWPETREFSQGAMALALAPLLTIANGVLSHVPSLVFLAVLFLLVRVGLRLIRLFFEAVEQRGVEFSGFDPDWAQPTYKLVRVGVVALAVIVAYPYIPGSDSEAFKGVSLFIGIVFSLGSSSAISNIIAGYMMTYRRAFKVGDRVKIGDNIGEVMAVRLQVTHLRSVKNEEIVIPNSQILGGEVINYSSLSRERGLILHTEVGIGYETPWRQVEAMLLTAAARTAGLGSKPPAFVLVKRLGDFAVVYEINAPCGEVMGLQAQYTALHHNILDVFNEHGVQIMTPAYEGDPPEPKIVPPKDWYLSPASVADAAKT